ncbi:MAG: hemolysin III family protein [Butyricicoccaceae bacterium]
MLKKLSGHGLYHRYCTRARDPISSYTHLWGAICSALAAAALAIVSAVRGGGALQTLSVGVFGLSLIALYTASSVFHYYNKGNAHVQLRLRKLDHSMIYVLIAGSYTPIAIRYMPHPMGFLAVIWGIALAGIGMKMIWMNAPRFLSTAIYVAMGWAVVTRPDAIANMPLPVVSLIAAGGISYSVGAVIYVLKKPNISETWGFHEIFHLLILLGSALMVIAVFLFL